MPLLLQLAWGKIMNFRSNETRASTGIRKWGAPLIAALATAVLAATAQAETKYLIDHEVWGGYQKYLSTIGTTKAGAFAITADGRGYFYSWCGALHCIGGPSYSHDAKTRCEAEYDTECVVFAVRRDIRIAYEIRN
ncbi:MAG TPA: hypothetical protein VGQ35_06915 [Dongiaceae bacterium]|jgi:hypothetical protein|nr:hypothetical protein [Dongiaceae bacterium]